MTMSCRTMSENMLFENPKTKNITSDSHSATKSAHWTVPHWTVREAGAECCAYALAEARLRLCQRRGTELRLEGAADALTHSMRAADRPSSHLMKSKRRVVRTAVDS